MKTFKVNEKCISCKACVRVDEENFKLDDKAVVYKQPINDEEQQKCINAMEICPTNAIEVIQTEIIVGESKVRDTIEKYPELKPVLSELSPRFKTMQNPVMWNTVAKFATFKDAAKMTGVSLCEILHSINKKLGVEDQLNIRFPECIKENDMFEYNSVDITWQEPSMIYNFDDDDFVLITKVTEEIKALQQGKSIVFESNSIIVPLIKLADELKLTYNVLEINQYKFRVSMYFAQLEDWSKRKNTFEILDVRKMLKDPFDIIIKKAYDTKEDDGFVLVQTFVPDPMLNMLKEMGFEYEVEKRDIGEVYVYLHKLISSNDNDDENNTKPSVVIQSATPVGYPIIMKLLQSKKIQKAVSIKTLKVWEETEKHLGWIANKKADISFSSVITASKLKKADVKMPIVFVWDNFSILTRGYTAKGLEDVKGKTISVPLFEDAPPAKISKYLIQAKGLESKDFEFVYGNPFGRPKQIMHDFVTGTSDTVLLREPEASFALKSIEKKGIEFSEIQYGDLWNEVNPKFGLLPNAGVVIKGEFARKHPEIVELIDEEIKKAINWVNANRYEAAKLSFDMMRAPREHVESFLDRVTFEYMAGDELVSKVKSFYEILINEGIVNTEIDSELLDMFVIDSSKQ